LENVFSAFIVFQVGLVLLFGIQFLAAFIHLHLIRQGKGHIEFDFFTRFFQVTVNSPGWPAIRATSVWF
jgi:hypothetical protein